MNSLQHILVAEPEDRQSTPAEPTTTSEAPAASTPTPDRPQARSENDAAIHQTADPPSTDEPMSTSGTSSTKRNATGATSSVYSGNKMKHLKKDDGIPLWRKDIQYDFLRLIFYDQTACFTKFSDGSKGNTYADIYIDAMAKSSKCSKILKDKLLLDRESAVSMAMVCLLVNIGRMNTTLNFFPEMRAQLRTYHSIPALQVRQDPNAYKQLQDAPRLKSILKGATEDEPQPSTIEEMMKSKRRPRTNPVNLIFIMSQYAPRISDQHFSTPCDFFDLIMRSSLSSASRARAFLWLNWWYLESDFTTEDSLHNPFGPGQYGDGNTEDEAEILPLKVPPLESLTEDQVALENVDTLEERNFGEAKRKERIAILASESSATASTSKRARKDKTLTSSHGVHGSDDEGGELGWNQSGGSRANGTTPAGRGVIMNVETASDYARSPSPSVASGFQAVNAKAPGDMRINNLLNGDDAGQERSPPRSVPANSSTAVKKGPGRGNWRRKRVTDSAADGSNPVPLLPNTGQISFVNDGPNQSQPATPKSKSNHQTNITSPSQGANDGPMGRDHVPTLSYQSQKRNRGITQHQSAVINYRKQHIEYALDRRIRRIQSRAQRKREVEGSLIRAWKRVRLMVTDYDSEEESIKLRKARDRGDKTDDEPRTAHRGKENDDGLENADLWRRPRVFLAGFVRVGGEGSDVGEELKNLAKTFKRCSRRLERWQDTNLPGEAMIRRQNPPPPGSSKPSHHRRSVSTKDLSMDQDGLEIVDEAASIRANAQQRKRTSRKKGEKRGRSQQVTKDQKSVPEPEQDPEPEPEPEPDIELDIDDGGEELDEEDRELLGEVDADESEEDEEDEDEDMAD